MLLSGKLGPQAPHKYAEFLLNVLDGEKKELITFDYAPHGTIMTTPMVADTMWGKTCGMNVFVSYVRNGGDLEQMDKSCADDMPTFNLTTPSFYLHSHLSTDNAYDGAYNSSLSSPT